MKNQKTKFVILGLLSIEPMSGYDIKSMISKSIGHFWAESNGQLYPALNQLLKDQLVVLDEKRESGRKAKKVYSITKQGLKLLQQWIHEKTEQKIIHRDEELLKLFFGSNTTKEETIELLKQRQKRITEKLAEFEDIQKEISKYSSSPHYIYWVLALQNGMKSAEAEISWCQNSIKTLLGPITK